LTLGAAFPPVLRCEIFANVTISVRYAGAVVYQVLARIKSTVQDDLNSQDTPAVSEFHVHKHSLVGTPSVVVVFL
jgi:hypothetical protein